MKAKIHLSLKELKQRYYSEWPDIVQQSRLRVLQAEPNNATWQYHQKTLWATAIDWQRYKDRWNNHFTPIASSMEALEKESPTCLETEIDIRAAFDEPLGLISNEDVKLWLIGAITWQQLSVSYGLPKRQIHRILKSSRNMLQQRLEDYAPQHATNCP